MGSGVYRLFLAALVVLEHTGFGMFGGYAVYSFFIMSGFWIAQMWQSKYSTMPAPYAAFLISRIWRLYPPFLLTAVVTSIALGRYDLQNLTFFTAAFSPNPLLPQTWSLSYEIQFYVLAPLFIVATRWRPACTLAAMIVYLLFAPSLTGVVCLAFFLLGIAGATHKFQPSILITSASAISGALLTITILALPALRVSLIEVPDLDPSRYIISLGYWRVGYSTLSNATLAMVLAGFTLWTLTLRSNRTDRAFGDVSYALYLVHVPIMFFYSGTAAIWFAAIMFAVLLWAITLPIEHARRQFLRNWSAWRAATA